MKFKQSVNERCSICGEWRSVGDHSKCSELRKQIADQRRIKSKAPRRLTAQQADKLGYYFRGK